MSNHPRQPSQRLTFDDAVAIWRRLFNGEFQSRIAACYDVNAGRIAEIKSGMRFPGSRESALRDYQP